MQLTQRTRRRVLQAVLPLVALVWASLPWLPCCQELSTHLAASHAGIGHAAHSHSDVVRVANGSPTPTLSSHAHHAPLPIAADGPATPTEPDGTDSDSGSPPCADVVKNNTEARPAAAATVDVALIGPIFTLPVLSSLVTSADSIDEPPRAVKRRPLHLAKSALLI